MIRVMSFSHDAEVSGRLTSLRGKHAIPFWDQNALRRAL